MMTIKQISSLAGVSVRTLQFYDEIGLFKPTKITDTGYRLYDEEALEILQQILFFKELDFTLKEITAIIKNPDFDKICAYKKQYELIRMKRDRLNGLLELLNKLIEGETCMDIGKFDTSSYFQMLNDFKKTHMNEIISRFESIEKFDELISRIKIHEDVMIDTAVKQYGSFEKYMAAIQNNLECYLSDGPMFSQSEASDFIKKTEILTQKLTCDLSKDVSSYEIQSIVRELVAFSNECSGSYDMGDHYWSVTAENFMSNPMYIKVNDKKYGPGASIFIGRALKAYLDQK